MRGPVKYCTLASVLFSILLLNGESFSQPEVALHAQSAQVHSIQVVLGVPTDLPPNSTLPTKEDVEKSLEKTRRFYQMETEGQVIIKVNSIKKVPVQGSCKDEDLLSDIKEHYPSQKYESTLLVMPATATKHGCSAGLGTISDPKNGGGYAYASGSQWGILAHEIGHNLGLGHANIVSCEDPDQIDPAVNSAEEAKKMEVETAKKIVKGGNLRKDQNASWFACKDYPAIEGPYGDEADMMGGGSGVGGLNAVELYQLGYTSKIKDITENFEGDLNRLYAKYTPGVVGLRITDPESKRVYFLQNRDAAAQGTWGTSGVNVIVIVPGSPNNYLIDATPSWDTQDRESHMVEGSVFTTNSGALQVEVLSSNAKTARIKITFK